MMIPPTSSPDYAKYIVAKHERMIHKHNHPFPPFTAVRDLYDRLSDGHWHSIPDLFAMIGVKKPRGRLTAVRDRGKYTGNWTVEEQNGQVRLVQA